MNSILVFTILLVISIVYSHFYDITSIDELEMTDNERNDIITYLDYLHNLLKKHEIIYWIIGGTTLGSVRHNDIVPWDDDADIGVFEYDLDKILALNDEIKNDGYEIVAHWKIYKFRKIGKEYPFVDIFCFKENNGVYEMNDAVLTSKWPNEYFLKNELFPLRQYKFNDLMLDGPNYPLDYLDRSYPKWRHIGYHSYDHKTNRRTNILIKLEQSNPKHKLKPYLYVKNKNNIKDEFDIHHNKKIITVE